MPLSKAHGKLSTARRVNATAPYIHGFTECCRFDSVVEDELSQLADAKDALRDHASATAAALTAAGQKAELRSRPPSGGTATAAEATRPKTAAQVLKAAEAARAAVAAAAAAPLPPSWPVLERRGATSADAPFAAIAAPAAAASTPDTWAWEAADLEEFEWLEMACDLVKRRLEAWQAADASKVAERERAALAAAASVAKAAALGSVAAMPEAEGTAAAEEGRFVLQAADGQKVYCDPLSTRLLVEHYGSWARVPQTICAPIVELSAHKGTDEGVRKRFKALCHLPTTCSFRICELDLRGIVAPFVLARSSEQIARRAERRAKRAEAEAKEAAARERELLSLRKKHGKSALVRLRAQR